MGQQQGIFYQDNQQIPGNQNNIIYSAFNMKYVGDEVVSDLYKNNNWYETIKNLFDKEKQDIFLGDNKVDVLLNNNAVLEIKTFPVSKYTVQQIIKNNRKFNKLTIWWIDCSDYNIKNIQLNIKYNIQNPILTSLYGETVPIYIDLGQQIWQVKVIKQQYDSKLFIQFIQEYNRQQLVELLNNHNGQYLDINIMPDRCKSCQQQTILNYKYNICQQCYLQLRSIQQDQWSHLYQVRQAGAGNAKTYTIVKKALDNLYKYENILFIVKTNGTKQVIIDKINEVMNDFEDNYIDWEISASYPYLNIYYIQFNSLNKQTFIQIATVDSFFCSIGCQNKLKMKKTQYSPFDFNYIASQIGESEQFNEIVYYKKIQIENSKYNTLFILDEGQDLQIEYCNAMFNLFKNFNMDFLIVGDKLQTIYIDTYNTISPMQKYNEMLQQSTGQQYEISQNICHRLQHGRDGYSSKNMIEFINQFINFKQFGLQPIQNKTIDMGNEDVKIFKHYSLLKNEQFEINENIQIILNIFRKHCDLNSDLYPNDFHIITPILKRIEILPLLESEINEFWIEELQRRQQKSLLNEKYQKLLNNEPVFCKLHINETDGLINLNISTQMTRIYSIHASKGEGRTISIILGLNQNSLELHSTILGDLKYESLLHVAVTRQKRYLYIGYSQQQGDIYQRLNNFIQYNPQAELNTNINQLKIDERFIQIKNDTMLKELINRVPSCFDNLQNQYKKSFKFLFGNQQYSLQQLEKILLGEITDMISNYDLAQPDIDKDDYELRNILFKYNIKQRLCTTKIKGDYLLKDLFYMGNIFDNNQIQQTYKINEYRHKMKLKNDSKKTHVQNGQKCEKNTQCECRSKYIPNSETNRAIKQICNNVNQIYNIMYNNKKRGFLKLICPVQMIVAVFFIYQHKYYITPVKLYYMITKTNMGMFKINQCQCNYCSQIKGTDNTDFSHFYQEMFNEQIIVDLVDILNQINPKKLQQDNLGLQQLPQEISKEISIKSNISLYDEQTQTSLYITQRLTEFNFRDILFQALIDCYIVSETGQLNAIIVSTNNQNDKQQEKQKYANNFKIDINKNNIKNAIEYLATVCYIRLFNNIFDQFVDAIQKQNNYIRDYLQPKQQIIYEYIEENINEQFIQNINYHKQYCLLYKYLKKNRTHVINALNKTN